MDALTAAFARYRQHGDLDALGRVFDSISPRLLALALHVTGNAADAEDALQATFMVAMQKSTGFDAAQPVGPWLAGILAGEAKNVRRRQQRRSTEALSEQMLVDAAGVTDAAEQRELIAQLRTHIDVLPTEQRQVLLLQLQHGLPPAEIAEVLGVPPGTVRMRIHRGLAALRRVLPASLAVSVLALFPERGLAAVRASVMKAGAVEVAALAATAVAVTIGGVAMKKVLFAAVAIVALCLAWWAALPPALEVPTTNPSNAPEVAVAKDDARDDSNPLSGSASVHDGVATRDQVAAAPGRVRVTVRADQVHQVSRMVQEVSSTDGSGVTLAGVLIELWAGKLDSGPIDGKLLAAQTNAAGVAEFERLAPGEYRLATIAGGLRLGGSRRVEVVSETWQEVEVHIALGGTVRGRVVDQRGTAVAGAEVWVGNRLSLTESAKRSLRVGAVSGDDGSFELHYVRHEEYVAARKSGFGASWSHPLQQLGDGEIELMLGSEAGTISGEVADQNGKPIAGVPIAIEPMQERLRRAFDGTLLGPRLGIVAVTDVAGHFAADGLAPGAYLVQAWQMPYGPATSEPKLAAGGHERVQLVMTRRAAVYGYLLDGHGKAKRGVYVMRGGQGKGTQTAVSNHDGSYRFEGVKFEPFTLSAVRMASGRRVEKQCAAPTSMETRVDLVLEEEPAMTGHAHTQSGRVVAGWSVTVFVDGDAEKRRKTRTRENGSFLLWNVPPGDHEVRLHRDPESCQQPDAMVMGSRGKPIKLVVDDALLPQASILGRLVDKDGKPIPFAWVTLPNAPILEDPEANPDGRFAFDDLDVGTLDIEFGAEGYVDLRRRIKLKPREKRDLGDVVLHRGATLRVRYQRPDGRPWQARPPVPWLRGKDGQVLVSGQIDYSIDGDTVIVTRIPAGTYDVLGPFGDELLIAKQTVTLPAGETRHLNLAVQVGRRRTLTFAVDKEQQLHVVVRRGDGLVVLDRKITREDDRMRLSAVLPIGAFRVDATGDSGSRFAGDIRITKHVGDVDPVAIPRTK